MALMLWWAKAKLYVFAPAGLNHSHRFKKPSLVRIHVLGSAEASECVMGLGRVKTTAKQGAILRAISPALQRPSMRWQSAVVLFNSANCCYDAAP